jgi:hypothetical protein
VKNVVRRLLRACGAIVAVVALAIIYGWWTTTPPDALAPGPAPAGVTIAAAGSFSVGVATVDLTPGPDEHLYLAGFGLGRKATGVHDPISARAVAIGCGDARVVLVAVDLIGIHHHHAERVRRRLAPRVRSECVLVAATHDHSAPDTMGLWGSTPFSSGVDPRFLDRALDAAALAAERALDDLRPARLRVATGRAPDRGVSKNKRDPDTIDRDVLVLAADDLRAGKPIATTVVFACHPEVLMSANTLITADFPGVLRREVEAARGGTCVFLNGPLGGMVTPDVADHTFDEMERVGKTLARTALDALAAPGARDLASGELVWVHRPIVVPIQNRRYLVARKLGVFDRPFEGKGYVESEVDALRLGRDLLVATVPGEALPRVGLDVKATLGAPNRAVLGLAGDELGYLIPEDAFPDPMRYPYEKTVSPGPLATTLVRGTAIQAAGEARDAGAKR